MSHPVERIASAVVDLLLDRIEGRVPPDAAPRQVTVTGELAERASVAPTPPA